MRHDGGSWEGDTEGNDNTEEAVGGFSRHVVDMQEVIDLLLATVTHGAPNW